ncbi:MAG: ATP-dependent DNA helicase RecG [Deltaproteobacteria bacterium]|nr:ATP-dependent DNA helicase RecG [Deltaproteobacteria bacterium]
MSRFRDVVAAILGPLEFAAGAAGASGGKRLDRVRNAPEALVAALRRAEDLDVPPAARKLFAAAAERVEQDGLTPEIARAVQKRLAPLLDDEYPLKVLRQPSERLPGVGPKIAAALARKDIRTVEDLLLFLPRAYEDRRQLQSIEDIQVGHPACFEGRVTRCGTVPMGNRRSFFQVVVSDGTAAVRLKWFRGIAHFEDRIKPGQRLLVAGDVRRYRYAKEIHHPDIEVLGEETAVESLARIVALYSAVEGVPPRTLRRVVEAAVSYGADLVESYLPEQAARDLGLPEVGESLRQVHRPSTHLDPDELGARSTSYHLRLVAEELFLLQAGLQLRRAAIARLRTQPLAAHGEEVRRAIESLPFELTSDQRQAWKEIAADLERARPMNRLLVGDVGTGKTVLAVLAAVAAHASGGLTAVLAPTEILAEQHHETLRALAGPLGLRVALLTGTTSQAERRSLARLLAHGEIAILVGTHALISQGVELPRLRLAVIDEQHRFGVEQRQKLGAKGERPHLLAMTATPIPRTLAFTLFGELDHSVIRERPPGRAPVRTIVVPSGSGRQVMEEVRTTLARHEQIYVVYPLVEESSLQDLQDATRGFERLRRALPESRIALLHGRLDATARVEVMRAFAAGKVDVLVSTTVIEVGVDVPNATLLVVQHAERFGLAQLHQLRGRVGRGGRPGTAILIGDPAGEDASRRLAVLEGTSSGFDIAEEDLRIRGAGVWLGTRQAGHLPELRLADLVRHGDLLPPIRDAAERALEHDPDLSRHPRLRAAVARRWGRRLSFGSVA